MLTATASPMTLGRSQTRSWKARAPRMRAVTARVSPRRWAGWERVKRPRVMPPQKPTERVGSVVH